LVWEALRQRSLYIEAAGGMVFLNQRMLWMQRHGRWDLPKGKAEPGERPEQTAIRECEEECGLQGLSLLNPAQCYKTHHWYMHKGYPALKCTVWYEMMASPQSEQDLAPQLEEGITSLEWIDYQRMYSEILPNTYPAIRCMVEEIYGPSKGLSAEMPRATIAGTKGAGFPP
jgi:8-oxo-dGTP pyrophosphatase MutT (NUDIX family)